MPEFARLSTLEVATDRIDDAVAFFNNTDLQGASASRGFRRAFWLLDRATGKGAELIVFDSREAIDGSEREELEARAKAREAGVNLSSETIYEVVAEGRPGT